MKFFYNFDNIISSIRFLKKTLNSAKTISKNTLEPNHANLQSNVLYKACNIDWSKNFKNLTIKFIKNKKSFTLKKKVLIRKATKFKIIF